MRLVVTCFADTAAELAASAARAAHRLGRQDLVEARFDLCLRPPTSEEVGAVTRAAVGRLLATCRRGGPGTPPAESERLDLLALAAREGARALDLEEDAEAPEAGGAQLWRSLHLEAEPTPEEAAAAVRGLARLEPVVLKLAAPCVDAASGHAWLRAAREEAGERACALVPMGGAGRGLRLLAGRGLSHYLYCAEERPAAEGQPLLRDVQELWHADEHDARAPLLAVVGHPLEASWSPALHGSLGCGGERSAPGLMAALPVRSPEQVLPLLDALGVSAAAVTMPHKRTLAAHLERLSERAARARSLNSLRRDGAGWEGESFDGPAAAGALATALELEGASVAILGAGGAAAALAAELAGRAKRVVLLARREGQAAALAAALGVEHAALDELAALRADAVVNATPADPAEPLAKSVAFDMRTTPADTAWLRRAEAAGLKTVDGLAMFARQAAAQRRWWRLEHSGDEEVEARLRALVAEREGVAP